MEAGYVLWLIKKWFWLIIMAALIGGAVGLAVNLLQPKMYESTTILYISTLKGNDYQNVLGAQQTAKAFALFPASDGVLAAALTKVGVRNLSSSQLSSMVTVGNNLESQFVVIKVRNSNPELAARLASAIAAQSTNLFMTTQSGYQVTIVQPAEIPQNPVGMGPTVVLAIGILVGLVVIGSVILFIEKANGILIIRPGNQIRVLDQETGLPMVVTVKNLRTIEKSEQGVIPKLHRLSIPKQIGTVVAPEQPMDGDVLNGLDPKDKGVTKTSEEVPTQRLPRLASRQTGISTTLLPEQPMDGDALNDLDPQRLNRGSTELPES